MLVIIVRHFQKKDPLVTGLFCALPSKSYFDRESHSPEGDHKTDFHKEKICWWGNNSPTTPHPSGEQKYFSME